MNQKIKYCLQWLREGASQVLRQHPLELLLIVCTFLGCLIIYEIDDVSSVWGARVALFPFFGALALAVNNLAGRGPWRKLYWVCWAPMLPMLLWSGLEEWFVTLSAGLTFGVLAPFAVLLCRRAVRNEHFMFDFLVWLRSAVLAIFFANVVLLLFCAILFSTTYIFALEGSWIEHLAVYALILCQTLAVPVLFLMMSDRWRDAQYTGSRIMDVLVNYIITPALMIYTGILTLYIIKILMVWELPRGGVAYLVFGFTLLSVCVLAVQSLLQKRIYDWFFNRFSLIMLPAQVLFWVGVMRRVSEYGLTQPRVLLLVCGGLMTLCILLFLTRRTGRYYWVALSVFVVFALIAYVPSLHPERIAVRSQVDRIERLSTQLGLLSEDGTLRLEKLETADTAQRVALRRLYESLEYVEYKDSTVFPRFGLVELDDFVERVPDAMRRYVEYGWQDKYYGEDYTDNRRVISTSEMKIDIAGYKTIYAGIPCSWEDDQSSNYNYCDDTLRIKFNHQRPDFVITGDELLRTQFRKIWGDQIPDIQDLDKHAAQLLDYSSGDVKIIFSNIAINRADSVYTIDDVTLNVFLSR